MGLTDKRRRETIHSKVPKPRPASPLHDDHQRMISKEGFGELFSLFMRAVAHEVGNSLSTVQGLAGRSGSERLKDLSERIYSSYRRIGLLEQLSVDSALGSSSMLAFSPGERERLCLDEGGLRAKPDKGPIMEIGLEEVRRFSGLLSELRSCSECIEVHDEVDEILVKGVLRSAEYGSLLSRSLERLMLGTLELEAENIDLCLSKLVEKSEKCCLPVHVFYQEAGMEDQEVRCNPIFATLIFENIASNALYAMHEMDIDHGLVLYIHKEGDALCLEFTDKGAGMSGSVMEDLNSGVMVPSRKGPGHGIGFQYCRELAEKMGGRLYVKSSVPGIGTTVALELELSSSQ